MNAQQEVRLDDLGNAARLMRCYSFQIDGNVRPVGFDAAQIKPLPSVGFSLNQHEEWLWFDANLNIWRLKPAKPLALFFGGIVKQPTGKIAHLVGQRNIVFHTKAYFKRVAGGAVDAGHHNIILPVNDAAAKLYVAIGPNFNFQNESFSDVVPTASSATGTGGASSPARKGGDV
jgi:hypothetical protein